MKKVVRNIRALLALSAFSPAVLATVVLPGGTYNVGIITDLGRFPAGTYTLTATGIVDLVDSLGQFRMRPDGRPETMVTYFPPTYDSFNPNGTFDVAGGYGAAGTNARIGALIGTLTATPTGPSDWFLIGYSKQVTLTGPGHIYASVNDTFHDNNTGFYDVIVSSDSVPTIGRQPTSQTTVVGTNVTFTVSVQSSTAVTYQWRKDGIAISGATNASLALTNVQTTAAGSYTVVVTNSVNSATGVALAVISAPANLAVIPVSRITNLSILTTISPDDPVFTVGAVIGGARTTGSKPLLIRAAGPSLVPLGVDGALSDPVLTVFSGQTITATNDDWGGGTVLNAAFLQVGAFAFASSASKDAAAFNAAMPSGGLTVRIGGVPGAAGLVLAELYDATATSSFGASTPRLINVSVLKQINFGEILTAGFVIAGTAPQQVLIRAVGPTLGGAPFNVSGAMGDPRLELFSSGAGIGSNDNWGGGAALSTAFSNVAAFALVGASRDAALLVTLQPGSYTVQVRGQGESSGIALVEIYEVP